MYFVISRRDVWQCGSRPISVSGRSSMATCLRREQRWVVCLIIESTARAVVDEGNIAKYPAYATCQGCVPGGDIIVEEM